MIFSFYRNVRTSKAGRLRLPGGFTLLLVGISALGAGLALAREVAYGVGLGWDSIEYISVARNLLEGDGFTRFFGGVYKAFPPLYPVLLAAASLGVLDPHAVAGPVNAAIFGMTVFVAGRYLGSCLESRLLALWGAAALALAVPLTGIASQAMAEPAFILLSILALIQAGRFLSGGQRSALLWAAAFTALACLTRFMGVTVIAAVVMLLLFQRGVALPDKAKRIAAYSLIAAAPVCLWMLRTFLLTGTPTGYRGGVYYSLPEILDGTFDALGGHFVSVPLENVPLIGVVFIVPVLLGLGIAVVRNSLDEGAGRADMRPLYIFGGFALVYFIGLVAAMMLGGAWIGGQARYLTPMYIPLLIAGLLLMGRLLSRAGERKPQGTSGGLPVIRTFIRGGK